MIDAKRFLNSIDVEFWNHLTTESSFKDIIDYKDVDRIRFVKRLANNLNHFQHFFETPEFLYIPKNNGILRRIKVFTLGDTLIYYYCLKELQAEISDIIKKIKYVYGGFKFSPDLMLKKQQLEELKYDPQYQKFAINSYKKEWNDYQNLAKALSERNFVYYIHIDIAHFYDDINLDILEKNLRNAIVGKDNIIDLLFYFLRSSDKKDLGYIQSNVGIPQEDIGEMSRLLANFYLHSFDIEISRILNEYFKSNPEEPNYIYTRFADDMWICFTGEKIKAFRVIQYVSNELLKLKLHISEKKLKILDKDEFNNHWHFETWNLIFDNKYDIPYLNDLLNKIYGENIGRWFSPFSYILKIIKGNANNINVLEDIDVARTFIERLFNNPLLISKLNSRTDGFYKALFTKHVILLEHIQNFLLSDNNIYPVVEYYLLEMLILQTPNPSLFNFFVNFFFNSNRKDYQWYSRALCMKFFIINTDLLEIESNRETLKKIINHLGNFSINQNYRERRYSIRLLNRLRDRIGNHTLTNYFTLPSDLEFKTYLESSFLK